MNKVILICGKICSGKTTYAKNLKKENNAIVLSVDEITLALFGQHIGEKHDEMVEKAENYLYKKAIEILSTGINVILDWGFWTKEERFNTTKYFKNLGIKYEWHYIDVDNTTWKKYLEKRNNAVKNNEEDFYIIDNNVAEKFWNIFEEPKQNEIDIWYKNINKMI
jgi:predicted kinase